MALTAQNVVERVFKQEFRGYDREEVDAFLDAVADRITELTQEQERIAAELRSVQEQATEGADTERLLKRTLIAAQRTADDTVAEARETAMETLSSARAEADRLLSSARAESEQTVEDATNQAVELVAAMRRQLAIEQEDARAGTERIVRGVEEFQRIRAEYRDRVRAVIAEQLDALDRVGELPEAPAALEDLARVVQEESARSAAVEDAGASVLDAFRIEPPSTERSGAEPADVEEHDQHSARGA